MKSMEFTDIEIYTNTVDNNPLFLTRKVCSVRTE